MEPNDHRYSAELTSPTKPATEVSPTKPAAEENRDLADLAYALAMVVVEQKSREQVAGKYCRDLEDKLDRLYSELSATVINCRDTEESLAQEWTETQRLHNVIDYISAGQNNNAELISTLRENITELEEAAEAAFWTESSLRGEIRRLEEQVDGSHISWLERLLDSEIRSNSRLHDKISSLTSKLGQQAAQIRNLQASQSMEETAGNRDNYSSDDNKSLFSKSDDDGST